MTGKDSTIRHEVNFDGLIGQTHHYGGLSAGNLASQSSRLQVSHPRAAALQGLAKMKRLLDLGLKQAVLPPHERPHWAWLRANGFHGTENEILQQVSRNRPELLSIAYSAAAMWAANAATVSPSPDTVWSKPPGTARIQFTPANLISTPHRRLEADFTHTVFKRIFADERYFHVHTPLPNEPQFADEGAANHMRLCRSYGERGLEVGVFGKRYDVATTGPLRYPARQSREASRRVFLQHDVQSLLVQQHPAAIDAGVFHNDVIAVANENVLLCHAQSFVDQAAFLGQIREHFPELCLIEIPEKDFSLCEAVASYLFNSQLLTLPSSPGEPAEMLLLCPEECAKQPRAQAVLEMILSEVNPIRQVQTVDVRQSLRNGGGPACLRLRVVMSEEELLALRGNVLLTPQLHQQLCDWVLRHYREDLSPADLADPQLFEEVRVAMDELTKILQLPSLYPFQNS